MDKCIEKNSKNKGLDKINPNHLKFKYEDLFFEVLGGVNTESYSMLRVMLVVRGNRTTERDHIDLYNNYQLSNFTKKVAERTGFSLKYVDEAFKELTDALETYKQELIEKEKAKVVQKHELTDAEKKQAMEYLRKPELLSRTNELIGQAGVIGNNESRLILFLTYLSRIQQSPLHAVVSSKHNYLQKKVAELIPSEHKMVIRHLSENVLFYFDEHELLNKLVLVEDTGTNRGRLIPLIDFQTNGELTKLVTQKDRYGRLIAVEKTIMGPVSLSISTPTPYRFKNNAVLSFVVEEDNSEEQDERIMSYQRKHSAGLVSIQVEQKAKELLCNIQRMLEPLRIVNPLAEKLILPKELKDKQISNALYLRFIEVVALFKQFQKEQKANELTGELYIEVDAQDIMEANELMGMILLNKCDGLNKNTRKYFEQLKIHLSENDIQSFTNSGVSLALDVPISNVKRYHTSLISKKLIRKNGNGNRATGYEFEVCKVNDFLELKKTVEQSLKTSLKAIEGSPKLRVAQNENELPKPTPALASSKVAQKMSGVHKGSNEIRTAV